MNREPSRCTICERLEKWRSGPFLIQEFEHSLFVVGDHQYFPGYCLLVMKAHIRELHELAPDVQAALLAELMTATNAVVRAFQPWKMNHASLGNVDPHVHWHLIPRYDDAPDHRAHPWLHADEFDSHKTNKATAREVAGRIRGGLFSRPE